MQVREGLDLTYCTNIHPAAGWSNVFGSIAHYGPALKSRLAPDRPFGLGLRLSATEAQELNEPHRLQEFQAFLKTQGLYVALINGFPYGSFHGSPLKAQVFAPDWRTSERVEYTCRLIEILAELLPQGHEGGVSTMPLSYKRWTGADDDRAWEQIFRNLLSSVALMDRIREETGKLIHLDIEPEPDGLVENTREFISFFHRLLRHAPQEMHQNIHAHVRVCYDVCHMAVEFEDLADSLAAFKREDIRIGRLQVSSALCLHIPADRQQRDNVRSELGLLADEVYLHQVIGRDAGGELERYSDLPEAVAGVNSSRSSEWRIHFHVPLFTREYGGFSSTQDSIVEAFRVLNEYPFTHHLEIETYTWSVLPPSLKQDLRTSIEREYRWVLDRICAER